MTAVFDSVTQTDTNDSYQAFFFVNPRHAVSDTTAILTVSSTATQSDSLTILFRPDTTPPDTVAQLIQPANGESTAKQPTLRWTAAADSRSGVAFYTIQIASTAAFDQIISTESTTHPDTDVVVTTPLSDSPYFWRVIAVDRVGNRALSGLDIETFVVQTPPPKKWYVNDTSTTSDSFSAAVGDTNNSGDSPGAPKRFLNQLKGLVRAGDTICIDRGIFNETEAVSIETGPLWIIGIDSASSILDFLDSSPSSTRKVLINAKSLVSIADIGIRNAGIGLHFITAETCTVDRVNLSSNATGFLAEVTTRGCVISNSAMSFCTTGIQILDAVRNRFTSNRVAVSRSNGIEIVGGDINTIESNTISGGNSVGILFAAFADSNTVRYNAVSAHPSDGFQVNNSDWNFLLGNTSTGNNIGFEVLLTSRFNTLRNNSSTLDTSQGFLVSAVRNTLETNTAAGAKLAQGFNISGDTNTLTGNTSSSILQAQGFLISGAFTSLTNNTASNIVLAQGFLVTSSMNTLTGNLSDSTSAAGFQIEAAAGQNTLDSNTARKSVGGHGFFVNGADANILRNNRAESNAAHGFYIFNAALSNMLRGNVADSNTLMGFMVESGAASNYFLNNSAVRNNGHGFVNLTSNATVFEANEARANTIFAFSVDSHSAGVTLHKNNILSTTNWMNADTSNLDLARNWWGTTDTAAIKARIAGGQFSSALYIPFRLAAVDTSFIADTVAPRAPDTVAAAAVATPLSLRVTWSPVTLDEEGDPFATGLDLFRIYRSRTADTTQWLRIGTALPSALSFTDQNVVNGESYSYRVTASDTGTWVNESFLSDSIPFATASSVESNVLINEIIALPGTDWEGDGAGADVNRDEWVELYNSSDSFVALAGWKIGRLTASRVTLSDTITPRGYLTVYRRTSGTAEGYFYDSRQAFVRNVGFTTGALGPLTNTGDTVTLTNAANDTLDQVAFPSISTDSPYMRAWDGATAFRTGARATPGAETPTLPASARDSNANMRFRIVSPDTARLNESTALRILAIDAAGETVTAFTTDNVSITCTGAPTINITTLSFTNGVCTSSIQFQTSTGTTTLSILFGVTSTGWDTVVVESAAAAPPSSKWYVNDGAMVGDSFTSAVGDTANSGNTPDSPKRFLNNLEGLVRSGDTIYVDAGTFFEGDTYAIDTGPLWIIGVDSLTTIVDFNDSGSGSSRRISAAFVNQISISNLAVRDAWHGIELMGVDTARIENVLTERCGIGVLLQLGTDSAFIQNSIARDNSNWGYYIGGGSRNTLLANTSESNGNSGYTVVSADSNLLIGNTARFNIEEGFKLDASDSSYLSGNTAESNRFAAFSLVSGSDNNRLISNIALRGLGEGFYLNASDRNTIDSNTATQSLMGFRLLAGSDTNMLRWNRAETTTQDAFNLNASESNLLTGNYASGGLQGHYVLANAARNNLILSNTSDSATGYGVFIVGAGGVAVIGNTILTPGYRGIELNGDSNCVVDSNAITRPRSSLGIAVTDSASNNLIRFNRVDSSAADGIQVTVNSDSNTIGWNLTTHSAGAGYSIHNLSDQNFYIGNTSSDDTGQGFFVNASSNTFIRNLAWSAGAQGFFCPGNNNLFREDTAIAGAASGFEVNGATGNNYDSCLARSNAGYGWIGVNGAQADTFRWNVSDSNTLKGFYCDDSGSHVFTSNSTYRNLSDGYNLVNNSNRNVVISNASLQDAGYGFIITSDTNTLTFNTATRNGFRGFGFQTANWNVIDSNTATLAALEHGFAIQETSFANMLRYNRSESNVSAGYQMDINADSNLIGWNVASTNTGAGYTIHNYSDSNRFVSNISQWDTGQGYYINSPNNLFEYNTCTKPRQQGYIVLQGGNTFDSNSVFNSLNDGFTVQSSQNLIRRSWIQNVTGAGLKFDDGDSNLLESSTILGSTFVGVWILNNSDSAVLRGNVSRFNNEDGFQVTPNCDILLLVNNVAESNTQDGFQVSDTSLSPLIIGNRAHANLVAGFRVQAGETGAAIVGNEADSNGGDGFIIWAASDNVLVARNRAARNKLVGFVTGFSRSVIFEACEADSNRSLGFYVDGTSRLTSIRKSNIYAITDTTGVYSDSAFMDMTRNWWGTADTTKVRNFIQGTGSFTARYAPFRLGMVDTFLGADTVAPDAPDTVSTRMDSLAGSVIVSWKATTLDEEADPFAPAVTEYRIYRSRTADTNHWLYLGRVAAPADTYSDGAVVHGETLYYRVTTADTGSARFINEGFFSDSVAGIVVDTSQAVINDTPVITAFAVSSSDSTHFYDAAPITVGTAPDTVYFNPTGSGANQVCTIIVSITDVNDTLVAGSAPFTVIRGSDTGVNKDTYTLIYRIPQDSSSALVSITVTDSGGLSQTRSIWFENDTVVPDTVTPSGPPAGTETRATSLTFSWTASADSGAGVSSYRLQIDTSGSYALLVLDTTVTTTSVTLSLPANETYFWRITTTDRVGNRSWSRIDTIVIDTALATAAQPSTPVNGLETRSLIFLFTWDTCVDSGSGIASYRLQISRTSTFASLVVDSVNGLANSTTVLLAPNDSYFWRIITADDAGNTTTSSDSVLFVDTTPPSPALQATPAHLLETSSTQIVFTWALATDAFTGLAGQRLQVDTSGAFTTLLFDSNVGIAATSGTLLLAPNDTFHWRILATDDAGNTTAVGDSIFVIDTTPPSIPALDTPTMLIDTASPVQFRWSLSVDTLAGLDSYRIRIDTSPAFGAPKIDTFVTSLTITVDLTADTYYWIVTALDQAGNSSLSIIETFSVRNSIDSAGPDTFNLTAPGNGTETNDVRLTFRWSTARDSSPPVTYRLLVDQDLLAPFALDTSLLDTFVTVTLAANDTYLWRVIATDNRGNSTTVGDSRIVVDTAGPTAPSLVSPTGGMSLTSPAFLDWNASTDAIAGFNRYRLQIDTSGAFTGVFVADSTTATPDTILSFGMATYFWRVIAIDDLGNTTAVAADSFRIIGTDTTPPIVLSASASPSSLFNTGTTTVVFTVRAKDSSFVDSIVVNLLPVDQAESTRFTQIDSITWQCTAVFDSRVVGDTYDFIVRLFDAVSNSGTTTIRVIVMDTTGSLSLIIDSPLLEVRAAGDEFSIISTYGDSYTSIYYEYRPAGGDWMPCTTLLRPNPDTQAPFWGIYWDISGLPQGTYDVRAVGTDTAGRVDPNPSFIRVVVDHSESTVHEYREAGTLHHIRRQRFFPESSTVMMIADGGTMLSIPRGAVAESVWIKVTVLNKAFDTTPTTGGFRVPDSGAFRVFIREDGKRTFEKEIDIEIPYADTDLQTDFVGTTSVLEENLAIYRWEEVLKTWVKENSSTVDGKRNVVSARVKHFTIFAVLAGQPVAAGLGNVIVYPNPFIAYDGQSKTGSPYNAADPTSGILFDSLPATVTIEVFNSAGRRVTTMAKSSSEGRYQWDARNDDGRELASGMYIVIFRTSSGEQTIRKVMVIR